LVGIGAVVEEAVTDTAGRAKAPLGAWRRDRDARAQNTISIDTVIVDDADARRGAKTGHITDLKAWTVAIV